MTTKTKPEDLVLAVYVGNKAPTIPLPSGQHQVVGYGDEIETTVELYPALGLLDDPEAQEREWGSVAFRRGSLTDEANADVAATVSLAQLEEAERDRLERIRFERRYGLSKNKEARQKARDEAVRAARQAMAATTTGVVVEED